MSRHTPAPWLIADGTFVYALNERGTNVFYASLQRGWKGKNADIVTPIAELEANAALISVAPDLLEALVRMEKWACAIVGAKSEEFTGVHPIAFANTVIARARGEA